MDELIKSILREIHDADIREISLVHSADGIPCNPEAKVEMYKSLDNKSIAAIQKYALTLKAIKTQNISDDAKKVLTKNALKTCLSEIEKINSEEINTPVSKKGEHMDLQELLKSLEKTFNETFQPMGKAITTIADEQKTIKKSVEDLTLKVTDLEKKTNEKIDGLEKSIKVEPQKTEKSAKPEDENTQKSDKPEIDKTEVQKALDELKAKMEKRAKDVLSENKDFSLIKDEMKKIESEILNEDDEIKTLKSQMDRLSKTTNDYNHEMTETIKSLSEGVQEMLKSLSQNQVEMQKQINGLSSTSKSIPLTFGSQEIETTNYASDQARFEKALKDNPDSIFENWSPPTFTKMMEDISQGL